MSGKWRRVLKAAPWIGLAMWGPFVAVRFLHPHHADGACSCTEGFEALLPVAPGFLPTVILTRFGPGDDPSRLVAGVVSIVALVLLSYVAASGRVVGWITWLVVCGLSTVSAIGLANALAA